MKRMRKLISSIYRAVIKVLMFLPLKKIVVFESNPDYACNTYPVFLQIKQAHPEYKCVWQVKKESGKHPLADDAIYTDDSSLMNAVKKFYYRLFAKAFVSCNKYMKKYRKDQVSLFLTHGSKTKKTRGIYEMGDKVDYILVQSHFFDDIVCYEYNAKPEQLVYLGYPRNDYFYRAADNIAQRLGLPQGSRYVIWLPTFRKSLGGNDGEATGNNLGVPLLYTVEALNALNDYLKEQNLFILYKPHPAQDISVLKASSLSNLLIINDQYLRDADLQLSEVLADSEALLTDYSSVFFDYILLDKPIGTTTDDIERWKESRGFAFDLDAMYDKSTQRIPDYNTLIAFLDNVLSGYDDKRQERQEIRELTNTYYDGDSAKRVVEFLLEKVGEKRG